MLILFDHGAPKGIARTLRGHTVITAQERGWDRLTNGDRLNAAEQAEVDLLLTTDRGIRYQQNLIGRKIALTLFSRTWEAFYSVAKLIYGLSQSLDGYVDHMKLGPPPPAAFRHFIELVRGLTGLIYGRRTYELMRYWDEDLPDCDAEDREFAAAYRSRPKWIVSHSLKLVGPNATLVTPHTGDDFEKVIRRLKVDLAGEILVGGPALAQSLTEAGLIDEYRLYLRPVVLGGGEPFFAGPRPPLHLVASDLIADDLIRLTYVPA